MNQTAGIYISGEITSQDQEKSGRTLSQQATPAAQDYGAGPSQFNARPQLRGRPKTNNTLSSFGAFEFLPGGYSESYVRAFNDKIKISELFEQNRLTQKIVDGRKRKNFASESIKSDGEFRKSNQTPSYMI